MKIIIAATLMLVGLGLLNELCLWICWKSCGHSDARRLKKALKELKK